MDEQRNPEGATFRLEVTLQGRGSFSASGDGEMVLRAFDEFRDEVNRSAVLPQEEVSDTTPLGDAADGTSASNGAGARPANATKGVAPSVPLPVFVREKAPKNNAEAVAVVAVHSKQYLGTEEFTNKSMAELWRGSGRKSAGNLARDIDTAVKSGWLHRQGRGTFVTTEYGEQFVAGLPAKKSE